MEKIRNFWVDESGGTAVEYALIMSLIAGAIVLALTALGTNLRAILDYMAPKAKAP
jgi:pilus assembly protein Flp/PilA